MSEPEAQNAAQQHDQRKGEDLVGKTLEPVVRLADRRVGERAAAEKQKRGTEGEFVGDRSRRFSGNMDAGHDYERDAEQRRSAVDDVVRPHSDLTVDVAS